VDNAFDEAKRMKGTMPKIIVKIDSKTNGVTVTDTGGGFINAEKINYNGIKNEYIVPSDILKSRVLFNI
jgi:hypothetical protein